jgi:peptidoglycan/LPS O-acetylase OafA/YrhL
LAILRWLAGPTLVVAGVTAVALDLADRRLFGLPYSLWALSFGALLVLVISAQKNTWLWRCGQSKLLRFFGQYSYGMYVFQLPAIYVLAPVITAGGLARYVGSSLAGQVLYCGVLFAAMTLAALASWHLFEKRILVLKSRFEPQRC